MLGEIPQYTHRNTKAVLYMQDNAQGVGCSGNKCLLEVEPKGGYFGNASLPNAAHIENPKIKLFTWAESGWHCINKYYLCQTVFLVTKISKS